MARVYISDDFIRRVVTVTLTFTKQHIIFQQLKCPSQSIPRPDLIGFGITGNNMSVPYCITIKIKFALLFTLSTICLKDISVIGVEG